MRGLRVLSFLALAFLAIHTAIPKTMAAPSSKSISQKEAAQKLVSIASAIQNHELQLSTVEHDLNQARAEESAILQELDQHNQRLMETIHYLRHATQYSPVLAMLSAAKPEDVIHSSMLLRSITPEIHYRNQQLLEKVKALSRIRAELEVKQNQLRDITFQYHQQRENLDAVLQSHPRTSHTQNDQQENNPDEVFTLMTPVVGKLIPTYKSSKPEWASYTQGVLFSSRPGAHVISPLSGIIAFAGNYANGQGKMVIVETPNSHIVMSGLDSLNCAVGQNVIAGEPIGRMPMKQTKKANGSAQNMPKLYLEVWHQEQTIDPQTILKERRKES